MKKSFLFIIVFLAGFFISQILSDQSEVSKKAESSELIELKVKYSRLKKRYESLNKAATNISNIDLKEYTELKSLEEKYKKADEILGKVMLLFLANIKVKMESKVQDYFANSERSIPLKKNIEDVSNDIPKMKLIKNENGLFSPINIPLKVEHPDFDQVAKSVEKTLINNPYMFYKNAKSAKNFKEILFLKGKFEGELYRIKGKFKGSTDKVLLEINFYEEEGKLKGDYISQLLRNGEAYSTNRGGGDNAQIRKVEGHPRQVLLETSPNSFIHLEITKGNDYYIGKYYDDDEFSGLVKLYRLN